MEMKIWALDFTHLHLELNLMSIWNLNFGLVCPNNLTLMTSHTRFVKFLKEVKSALTSVSGLMLSLELNFPLSELIMKWSRSWSFQTDRWNLKTRLCTKCITTQPQSICASLAKLMAVRWLRSTGTRRIHRWARIFNGSKMQTVSMHMLTWRTKRRRSLSAVGSCFRIWANHLEVLFSEDGMKRWREWQKDSRLNFPSSLVNMVISVPL